MGKCVGHGRFSNPKQLLVSLGTASGFGETLLPVTHFAVTGICLGLEDM